MFTKILAKLNRAKTKAWLWIDNKCAKWGFLLPGIQSRYTYNPLLKYPRNLKCFCGSNKKAKACCLKKLKRTVPIAQATQLHKYMAYVEGKAK